MFQRLIAIMGMPRSGTSWLGQIFDSCPQTRFRLSPLFSYEFKNQLNEASNRRQWEEVLRGAYLSDSEFMDQTTRRQAGQYPVFADKHSAPTVLVLKDTRFHNMSEPMLDLFPEARLVHIVRHPAGAINSWLRTPREFPPDADPCTEWRNGTCRKTGVGEYWGFNDWMSVTRMYLRLRRQRPEQVMVQSYEALVSAPQRETQAIFKFAGIDYGPQTEAFLRDCHCRHEANEYAVFKNPDVSDQWRTQLDPTIADAIHQALSGTDLEVFL